MAMSSDEAYYENKKHMKDGKGKTKIYNLDRHSRDKFQERLDFKFYGFQALEIEKGWNKLFVSIISMETGETIAKSGAASVQNGQCNWEDSMISTIWINSDDSLQHINEGCLLKFVVAMGSAMFGILGEAIINLASYIRPQTCIASLPLKQHCSHGTILQVKIQCLTPTRNHRKNSSSYMEEMSVGLDDVDSISNVSDNTNSMSSESSHFDQLENTYYRELNSKRTSSLERCSDHDIGSVESSFSFWIGKFPHQSNSSGLKKMNERQDSFHSKKGYFPSVTSSSGTQLQDKMEKFVKVSNDSDTKSTRSAGSSKDVLGAAQVTIELLHGEVKMWEENARKLMNDVERLQKNLNKKSRSKKDLEMELSAACKENDELNEEIHRLTTMGNQSDSRNLEFQIEDMDNIIKELKDEIKYQKGLNYDLDSKLKKTQESNINLVSILRKLEKIIEKQKMEIADLSITSSQSQHSENRSHGLEDSLEEDCSLSKEVLPEKKRNDIFHSDADIFNNENAIRCLHEGIELQEFRNLELEHRLTKEKQKKLETTIQLLEKSLQEKEQELKTARCYMAQTLEENETKWRNKLFEKGKQIINFENKLSDGVHAIGNEILALTQRVQDLEAEFSEKHGESREDLMIPGSFSSNFLLFDSGTGTIEVFLELYKQLQLSVKNLKGQDSFPHQMTFNKNENCFNISDLSKVTGNLDLKELTEAILCTIIMLKKLLETKASSFEYEIDSQNELVRKRIEDYYELKTKVAYQRPEMASKCSTDSPNDMKFPDWTIDSQTLVKKDDVRNLSESESSDDEQNDLFELEAEKVQLSERIFSLEDEATHLRLALENSENVVINLQAEIKRMEIMNEEQKVDLKRQESLQKKLIEAREECSFQKAANLKLKANYEDLIKVSKTLEKTNDDLRMQNWELHNQCALLESKLGESQIAFSDMLKVVEDLEYRFTSVLDEIALKEKSISLSLDALVQEIKMQDDKFIMEEKFLEKMYLEKTAEVVNLQTQVEHLRDQISGICDIQKRIASNIVLQVYDLCADKAMLEASHQEEYEVLVQNYEKAVVSLENIKSNEEELKSNVRKLEVELKASELERLQATEEISELEVRLQKTEMLQGELFILKRSLYEAEFEYRKLEDSYQMLSLEYDELKAKEISYIQRISTCEKVASELETCKRTIIELEEKIKQLEWDLTTKEASCRNNVQLRYELAQQTRENGELNRKKDSLQQENEEYQKKVKALEEKLKQKEKVNQELSNDKHCSTPTTAKDNLTLLQKEDT